MDTALVERTECEPLQLHPDTALMGRRLQDALADVTGIHLTEVEALMVASAIAWS